MIFLKIFVIIVFVSKERNKETYNLRPLRDKDTYTYFVFVLFQLWLLVFYSYGTIYIKKKYLITVFWTLCHQGNKDKDGVQFVLNPNPYCTNLGFVVVRPHFLSYCEKSFETVSMEDNARVETGFVESGPNTNL